MLHFPLLQQLAFPQFLTGGTHSITWDARNSTDPAQVWDLKNTGVRVFRFVVRRTDQ
jgi:hypothetical protein